MLTLPKRQKRQSLTVEVEETLLKEVKALAKRQGLTMRQIVEFGLTSWIEATRPQMRHHHNCDCGVCRPRD